MFDPNMKLMRAMMEGTCILYFMNSRRIITILIFFVLVAVLGTGAFTLYGRKQSADPRGPCGAPPGAYACYDRYAARMREIAETQGIAAGMAYLNELRQTSDYHVTHTVLHVLGHEAYLQTHDVKKALAYLPPEADTLKHYFDFDGFPHGILEAFFMHQRDRAPLDTLIREACADYFNGPLPDEARDPLGYLKMSRCFHAAGHALMFVANDDVDRALPFCNALPELPMRSWCRIGVFMENAYLYSPHYRPDAPRPSVEGDSMHSLCERLKGEGQEQCMRLVGWSLLRKNETDYRGALAQCESLEKMGRNECLSMLGQLFLPRLFGNSIQTLADICNGLPATDRVVCIKNVSWGIKMGVAGYINKDLPFCNLVAPEFKERCAHPFPFPFSPSSESRFF